MTKVFKGWVIFLKLMASGMASMNLEKVVDNYTVAVTGASSRQQKRKRSGHARTKFGRSLTQPYHNLQDVWYGLMSARKVSH